MNLTEHFLSIADGTVGDERQPEKEQQHRESGVNGTCAKRNSKERRTPEPRHRFTLATIRVTTTASSPTTRGGTIRLLVVRWWRVMLLLLSQRIIHWLLVHDHAATRLRIANTNSSAHCFSPERNGMVSPFASIHLSQPSTVNKALSASFPTRFISPCTRDSRSVTHTTKLPCSIKRSYFIIFLLTLVKGTVPTSSSAYKCVFPNHNSPSGRSLSSTFHNRSQRSGQHESRNSVIRSSCRTKSVFRFPPKYTFCGRPTSPNTRPTIFNSPRLRSSFVTVRLATS